MPQQITAVFTIADDWDAEQLMYDTELAFYKMNVSDFSGFNEWEVTRED